MNAIGKAAAKGAVLLNAAASKDRSLADLELMVDQIRAALQQRTLEGDDAAMYGVGALIGAVAASSAIPADLRAELGQRGRRRALERMKEELDEISQVVDRARARVLR